MYIPPIEGHIALHVAFADIWPHHCFQSCYGPIIAAVHNEVGKIPQDALLLPEIVPYRDKVKAAVTLS